MSGGSRNFRELKVEDALLYLDQVKAEFGDRPEIYNEFLEIMKSFKSQEIDTPGVICRVSTLFRGYGKLIYGFNTFLPEGYKIDVPPELRDQVRGEILRPLDQRGPQRQSWTGPGTSRPMGAPVTTQPKKDEPQQPPQQPQQQRDDARVAPAPGTAMEGQQSSVNMRQPPEFDNAIAYVTAIKKRFAKEPETYKAFLEVLHTYQREQKGIQDVLTRVAELFKDHADLLREFTYFLPDAAIEPAQRLFLQRAADDADERSRARQASMGEYSATKRAPAGKSRYGDYPEYGGDGRVGQPARGSRGGPGRGRMYPPQATTGRPAGKGRGTGQKYGLRYDGGGPQQQQRSQAASAPKRGAGTKKQRPQAPPGESLASLRRQAAQARATARAQMAEEARQRAIENLPRQLEIDILKRVRKALCGSDGGLDKFPPADLDLRKKHVRGLARSRPAVLRIKDRPRDLVLNLDAEKKDKPRPSVIDLLNDDSLWDSDSDSDDDLPFIGSAKKRDADDAKVAAIDKAKKEDDKAPAVKEEPMDLGDDNVVEKKETSSDVPPPAVQEEIIVEKTLAPTTTTTTETSDAAPKEVKKEEEKMPPQQQKLLVAKTTARRARKERLEREAVWRDVLKVLDLCAQGVLSPDDGEALLKSALEDAVDWGHGTTPSGTALASDIGLLLRKSARLAPTAECANQSVILARRALAPGRGADPTILKVDLERAQAFAKAQTVRAGEPAPSKSVTHDALSLFGEKPKKPGTAKDKTKKPTSTTGTRAATRRANRPSTRATSPPPEDEDDDDASMWSGGETTGKTTRSATAARRASPPMRGGGGLGGDAFSKLLATSGRFPGDWTSLPLSELDFFDDDKDDSEDEDDDEDDEDQKTEQDGEKEEKSNDLAAEKKTEKKKPASSKGSTKREKTPSYRRLPETVPRAVCSHRSDLDVSVLNDDFVSVATTSDDANYSTQLQLRRNAHEEALFKAEDEHFEIDMVVDANASAIRALDALAAHGGQDAIFPDEGAVYAPEGAPLFDPEVEAKEEEPETKPMEEVVVKEDDDDQDEEEKPPERPKRTRPQRAAKLPRRNASDTNLASLAEDDDEDVSRKRALSDDDGAVTTTKRPKKKKQEEDDDDDQEEGRPPMLRRALSPIHLAAICRVYGDRDVDALKALRKAPGTAAEVIATRLREKDFEWRATRHQLARRWRRRCRAHFAKSLDHRAHFWRALDKKRCSAKWLVQEIKDLYDSGSTNDDDDDDDFATLAAMGKQFSEGRGQTNDDKLLKYDIANEETRRDAFNVVMQALENSSTSLTEKRIIARDLWRDFVGELLSFDPSLAKHFPSSLSRLETETKFVDVVTRQIQQRLPRGSTSSEDLASVSAAVLRGEGESKGDDDDETFVLGPKAKAVNDELKFGARVVTPYGQGVVYDRRPPDMPAVFRAQQTDQSVEDDVAATYFVEFQNGQIKAALPPREVFALDDPADQPSTQRRSSQDNDSTGSSPRNRVKRRQQKKVPQFGGDPSQLVALEDLAEAMKDHQPLATAAQAAVHGTVFANEKLYVFVRLFHMVYERLADAKRLCTKETARKMKYEDEEREVIDAVYADELGEPPVDSDSDDNDDEEVALATANATTNGNNSSSNGSTTTANNNGRHSTGGGGPPPTPPLVQQAPPPKEPSSSGPTTSLSPMSPLYDFDEEIQRCCQLGYAGFLELVAMLLCGDVNKSTFDDACREILGNEGYKVRAIDRLARATVDAMRAVNSDEAFSTLRDMEIYPSEPDLGTSPPFFGVTDSHAVRGQIKDLVPSMAGEDLYKVSIDRIDGQPQAIAFEFLGPYLRPSCLTLLL